MSKELKCLKNSDTKAYIIPTAEWLQPIEPLITNGTNAKVIISKLLNKEKILVRLTSNNNKRLPLINSKLSKLPGFPLTYCTIICTESSDLVNAQYTINGKPAKGFCNGKSFDGYYTLELMKYYKSNKLIDILNVKIPLDQLRYFLDQALGAQIIAFERYGFVHNDININNFILEQQKTNVEYRFDFDKRSGFKPIGGKINFKVYVIDFGSSEFLNPEYRSQYTSNYWVYRNTLKLTNPEHINDENTLPNNLFETVKAFLELCPNYIDNLNKINQLETQSNQMIDFYNFHYNRHYYSMCNSTNDFDMFMYKVIPQSIRMLNQIYQALFGEQFTTLANL